MKEAKGPGLKPPRITDRKADHINISTLEPVEPAIGASWSDVMLVHNCLPEIDFDEIDLSVEFLGRRLSAPVVISSMTGGHELARSINGVLAGAAEHFGLAMGVGSQRAYVKNHALAGTYSIVRKRAPNAFIIGNVGAPQLIEQAGDPALTTEEVQAAIDLVRADALAVHLNYLQEMIQPEGDTRARGVLAAVGRLVAGLSIPVIAKETGAGMARTQAEQLKAAGVSALDVGGLGGTSFAMVESVRARLRERTDKAELGDLFGAWGIPTMASIPLVRPVGLPVIGTGGIRSGLDAARALALGADVVGIARPLLVAAQQGIEATGAWLRRFLAELRTAMFLTGSANVRSLQQGKAVLLGESRELVEALSAVNSEE